MITISATRLKKIVTNLTLKVITHNTCNVYDVHVCGGEGSLNNNIVYFFYQNRICTVMKTHKEHCLKIKNIF